MNRAISQPAVLLHVTSEDGHRASYLSLLNDLLNGARAQLLANAPDTETALFSDAGRRIRSLLSHRTLTGTHRTADGEIVASPRPRAARYSCRVAARFPRAPDVRIEGFAHLGIDPMTDWRQLAVVSPCEDSKKTAERTRSIGEESPTCLRAALNVAA